MFILRQASLKMSVLFHKQPKVPFILIIAVNTSTENGRMRGMIHDIRVCNFSNAIFEIYFK